MILRPYQTEAVQAVLNYFQHNTGNPIVALPTGTGKSLVIAALIQEAMNFNGQRVLILTHVKELVEQNCKEARAFIPGLQAGIVSAGLGFREYNKPVVFAGIASLYRSPEKAGRFDLILIDEVHLCDDTKVSMYAKTLDAFRVINPRVKIIGLSATPYRLKYGMLTEGKLFSAVVCDYTSTKAFNSLVESGYIAPLIPRAATTEIDLSGVRTVAGDYKKDELQTAMRTATQSAVLEIIKHGAKRKKWLIFCAGIQHADEVATAIAEHGIDIVTVHSKMSEEQRDENIARFRTGTARAIVNMGVLTTGFNCPAVDLLAVLRPTKSPGLWCQILGRGTRPAPGKTDCLVLDFGRNTERLGPINAIQPPPKPGQKQGGIAPMKICGNEDCRTWIHASAKVCSQCGYEFPVSEKLERTASSLKLIADGKPKSSEWRKVDAVNYSVHRSKTGRDTLLVLYRCGFDSFREYICIGYPGFPGKKAQKWIEWRTCELINTPAEALKAKLKKPSEILINFAEKWPRITDCKF